MDKIHRERCWEYGMRFLRIITLAELGGAQSVVINLANSLSKEHEFIVAA